MRSWIDRWWYGYDPIVGIDIRDDRIMFAHVDRRGTSRWIELVNSSATRIERGMVHDREIFISALKDFTERNADSIQRCAVALPESLTYLSRVTLPEALRGKAEGMRYEAALEQVYLRPHDVRGKLYPLRKDPRNEDAALLVAVKVTDVEPLEEAIAMAGVELACLTPRVLALHHLVTRVASAVSNETVAYSDLYATPPYLHLFTNSEYHTTLREWSGSGAELDHVSWFVVNGPHESEVQVQRRYPSSRVVSLRSLVMPDTVALDPKQVVAGALSLWEGRGV